MIHLLFIIILFVTGTVDAVTRKIHNISVILIVMLAILHMIFDPVSMRSCIAGFFILSFPMLLLTLRRGGLGGGDIKLTAACGLFLGVDALLTGFLIAGLLALASYFVYQLHENRKQEQRQHIKMGDSCSFPFGPHLAIGFIIAVLIF